MIREFISSRAPADAAPVKPRATVARALPPVTAAAPARPARKVATKAAKPAATTVASPFAPKARGSLGAKLYGPR